MRIIFLDIDGVLNHCDTRSAALATAVEPLPLPIAPECMERLNRLVAETDAKIVISSSWRLFARWQDLGPALHRHGLVADVVGGTPDLVNDDIWLKHWHTRKGEPFSYDKLERGWEIREWLAHFAMGVCSCGHEGDLHECGADQCFYNERPSGASGCLCRRFDGSPLTGFVILDDVSDMDELKPWLVLTHPNEGLADPDVERAKWLLERSTDRILRAREHAFGTGV
jgi:hypothetical protein